MTVSHKSYNIEIHFAFEDWDRHLAQKAIEYIKLLGKGNYTYQFSTKKWTIRNTPENRKYLKAFRDKWLEEHKDEPKQLRLDLDEFDINKWLDETFRSIQTNRE